MVKPSRTRSAAPREAANAGITFIEVLIAAVVLAVGMIGAAGILLRSLQTSRLALQHSHAVFLVADVADRIRANPAGGAAFAVDEDTILAAPAYSCDPSSPCTATDVAALDLQAWQQCVFETLPDASTVVTVSPSLTPGINTYTVTIRWAQSGDAAPASLDQLVQA